MRAQGLGDACTELFRLNQYGDQVAQIVYVGALREMLPGLGSRASSALFEHHDSKLIADGRMRMTQLLRSANDCQIQTQTRLDADHHQIQHIRKAAPDTRLPFLDAIAKPEVRSQIAHTESRDVHHESAEKSREEHNH